MGPQKDRKETIWEDQRRMVSPEAKREQDFKRGNGRPVVSVISEKPRRRNAKTYWRCKLGGCRDLAEISGSRYCGQKPWVIKKLNGEKGSQEKIKNSFKKLSGEGGDERKQ